MTAQPMYISDLPESLTGDPLATRAGAARAVAEQEGVATLAIDEEVDDPTTLAVDEDGLSGEEPTTLAIGEEGDDDVTTLAIGEEAGAY
ncbi:MAG: hypothetical protein Q8O56_06915 [Solirubrobacteraceae bacterium]|nr:hypothetical protein [Solirubrobacteraceae bacterium]